MFLFLFRFIMSILNDYYYYMKETRDPRTMTWPLTSFYALVTILFCYLYFIFGCGPRYMKDKPAYNLQTVIRCYNIFQIVVNIMLAKSFFEIDLVKEAWSICSPITYSTDPRTMQMVGTLWWAYSLKIFDLVETMFFILRKKNRQVSVLHVHHHVMSVFLCWLAIRYMPSGIAACSISLNCCVHVIMYTYYFLSSLNQSIQRTISPFKPIITAIQMVQLVVIILYIMMSFVPNCVVPKFLAFVAVANIAINFYYFRDFYKKTYSIPKRKN